jgi:hypothetical protein
MFGPLRGFVLAAAFALPTAAAAQLQVNQNFVTQACGAEITALIS